MNNESSVEEIESSKRRQDGEPIKSTPIQPEAVAPPVERIATLFARGKHGYASLPTAVSASLRRMDTNRPARMIGSVISALVSAELPVQAMDDDELLRWATLIHAIALLSGTAGKSVHNSSRQAGKAIADARYSNTRFARLLTAQGSALPPQVIRLIRFLSKTPHVLPLDLRPIAELLLWDGRDIVRADAARMTLARAYYTGVAAKNRTD